jgi:electron transfer flavoprotein beta subunit
MTRRGRSLQVAHRPASAERREPDGEVSERMNIVVLVKQVPDTEAERKLNPDDNTVDRAAIDPVINYIDEFAIEEGLRLKEAHDGEVTILTVGPERAAESIRKALSMGADKAIHVSDEALHGSDAIQTAKVIAKALGTVDWDVAIAGSEATDSRAAIVPALVAEVLGVAQLTQARKVTVDGSTITIERVTDTGYEAVQGSTPAVISVVEKINDPRYPSFKGIMAAKSKPVTVLGLSDLGMDSGEVGLANAWTQVVSFENAPPRAAGQTVKDEGNGGGQIADYLASKKLI